MSGRAKEYSRRLLVLSLVLSMVTITATMWINVLIAERYENATGKTRAMFGIIELTFGYKYYLAIVGLIAIVPGIIAVRRGQRRFGFLVILIAITAFVLVFLRVWTLMADRSD